MQSFLLFLAIMGVVVGITGYLCLSVKIALIVGEWAEGTGFDAGFYLMTVVAMLALPFAIGAAVSR